MKPKSILPLMLATIGVPFAVTATPNLDDHAPPVAPASTFLATPLPPFVVNAPRSLALDLVLNVQALPTVQPFGSEDARQVITERFQEEFKTDGFKGSIDVLTADELRGLNLPRLEISLTDWRVKPSRVVDCAFTATLITPEGVTPLGLFDGSSLLRPSSNARAASSTALNQAATQAIDHLYHELHTDHLLPANAP